MSAFALELGCWCCATVGLFWGAGAAAGYRPRVLLQRAVEPWVLAPLEGAAHKSLLAGVCSGAI